MVVSCLCKSLSFIFLHYKPDQRIDITSHIMSHDTANTRSSMISEYAEADYQGITKPDQITLNIISLHSS